MPVLPKGANAPLNATDVNVVLEWSESGRVAHDIDLCGLLLGSDGRVQNDSDFIFYNQPSHPSGAIRHLGRSGTTERLNVNTSMLPSHAEKVVLAGSISEGSFGEVKGLAVTIVDAAGARGDELRFESMGAGDETAFVVGELYLRNGQWKFRAVGQGWESGLAGLAMNYGVGIETPVEPETAPVGGEDEEAMPVAVTPGTAPQQSPAIPATPPAGAVTPAEVAEVSAQTFPRLAARRITPGVPNLDGGLIILTARQHASLIQKGQTPEILWLRISHTGKDEVTQADLAVLEYNEYGTPKDVVYYGNTSNAKRSIRLVNKPIADSAGNTAAVELRMASVDDDTIGMVIAATTYGGRPLTSHGSFVTELVAVDGTVYARSESTAPNTTGLLLAALQRDTSGAWVLTPLASEASGRTAKSLVGAGHWALCA